MNKSIITSLIINLILVIIIVIIVVGNQNAIGDYKKRESEIKFKMLKTLAYSDNYARKLEEISNVADRSHDEVRKAYDIATGEKMSRQLALDSVYVIKEWIDKAKKSTENWPDMNRDEIDTAFIE